MTFNFGSIIEHESDIFTSLVFCTFFLEYIFLLSEEMELPTETRFHALELFDK